MQANEERTATGIVIGRNLDEAGSLKVWLLEHETVTNRAKLLKELKPTPEHRLRIAAKTPRDEVPEEQLLLPVPVLTKSTRKASDNSSALLRVPNSGGVVEPPSESMEAEIEAPNDPQETFVPLEEVPVFCPELEVSTAESADGFLNSVAADLVTGATPTLRVGEGDPEPTAEVSTTVDLQSESLPHIEAIRSEGDQPVTDDNNFMSGSPVNTNFQPTRSRSNPSDLRRDRPDRSSLKRKLEKSADPDTNRPQRQPSRTSERERKSTKHGDYSYVASTGPQSMKSHCPGLAFSRHMLSVISVVYNMSLVDMEFRYPDIYMEPVRKELSTFHDKNVGTPIKTVVPGLKHSKILKVRGFGREVVDPVSGCVSKLKFRLVPAGHLTDPELYGIAEKTSPTVSMDTIFATCNVAAYERMQGFTMDIPGAYLNANLKDPHMVRFQKDIAAIYVNMYPEYREYLQPDGTLLLLVQKAFYGLPESSQLWYNEIRGFLIAQGFEWNPVDPGLFMKTVGDDRIILSLWVDDFLGFASKRSLIDELKAAIEERFGDSRFNDNNVLAFLGMTITQPNQHGEVFVSVEEYIKRICEQSPFELRYLADPNHKYLLRPKPKDKIEPVDSTQFLSLLMKAMWAAKRVRADVLIALSILASRGKNPDNFDMMCLEKVNCYLYSTQGMGLRFAPNSMTLLYWVDAAMR